MNITHWYAISLGALVASFLSYRLYFFALSTAHVYGGRLALKYLVYPQIPKLLRGEGTITRLHVLIILIYITGNIVCTVSGVTNFVQLRTRLGLMSLVNLMPLCLGGRITFLGDLCGLSYENYSRIHRWIGRITILHGLLHIIIASTVSGKGLELGLTKLPGLLAACGMLLILLLSFYFIRNLFYELFVKLHLLLAILTVTTLWYHVTPRSNKIYLIIAIGIWCATTFTRVILLFYRNFGQGQYTAEAVVERIQSGGDGVLVDNTIKITLKIRRLSGIQAGQYLYLCIPRASIFACLQSHPFMIAWWDQDTEGNTTVFLLVRPCKGFTRNIFKHLGFQLSAFVEGPYGVERDFGLYGTVVMLATGIGIAGQLLYIRSLLEGYNNCEVRTRNIFLHWQLEKECQEDWVSQWMDKLLVLDTHKILKISLFVLGGYRDRRILPGQTRKYGNSNRITKFYVSRSPDIEEFLRNKIREQSGSIIFTACASSSTTDKVRKIVAEMPRKDIRFEALPFCP